MDVQRLRRETPGCQKRIHLNNAGAALMPEPVLQAVEEHLRLESEIGGYEAAAARAEEIDGAYAAVAGLVGAQPRNIAFTENATASYAQALSSIPFRPGDVILTTRNDYASNQIQFLSLQSRLGVGVLRAPDHPQGGVDVSQMRQLILARRPRLVAVTQVPTNSGLIQQVAAIGSICRSEGILYLVDACQSVGQMPVDVEELGCDFLSATSRKFLRGPRGSGFLFVSERVLEDGLEPLFIDMRGADWVAENRYRPRQDARRFENWEFCWSLVLGTAAAARYAMSLGLEPIQKRAWQLARELREGLQSIPGVTLLDRGEELSAIVTVGVRDWIPPDLVRELRRRGINTSALSRESAAIDFSEKGVAGALRLSPHYYNTSEEIAEVVRALRELASKPGD